MNYIVQQGDCMASIAADHGFVWQTLWGLPQNAALQKKRKDPYVLMSGDQVFIPDIRIQDESGATDAVHTFELKSVTEQLRIVITDDDDQPVSGQPYTLVVDGKQSKGQTDGGGAVVETIAPNARKGILVVGTGDSQKEYYLGLGCVDPLDEVSGAQGRLLNLGYYDGPVTGQLNAQTTTAILLFQEKYELSPTGLNDAPTQAKLKELFGC